jgi:hypothetical protein
MSTLPGRFALWGPGSSGDCFRGGGQQVTSRRLGEGTPRKIKCSGWGGVQTPQEGKQAAEGGGYYCDMRPLPPRKQSPELPGTTRSSSKHPTWIDHAPVPWKFLGRHVWSLPPRTSLASGTCIWPQIHRCLYQHTLAQIRCHQQRFDVRDKQKYTYIDTTYYYKPCVGGLSRVVLLP